MKTIYSFKAPVTRIIDKPVVKIDVDEPTAVKKIKGGVYALICAYKKMSCGWQAEIVEEIVEDASHEKLCALGLTTPVGMKLATKSAHVSTSTDFSTGNVLIIKKGEMAVVYTNHSSREQMAFRALHFDGEVMNDCTDQFNAGLEESRKINEESYAAYKEEQAAKALAASKEKFAKETSGMSPAEVEKYRSEKMAEAVIGFF